MEKMLVQWFVTGLGMAAWGIPFILLLFFIGRVYLTSYANKKGENLATKEDVRAITREVEAAKEQFNHRLEDLKAHHQLRMVAAERRLQALQEAYRHWYELYGSVSRPEANMREVVIKSQEWFASNCVFLSPKSRGAFLKSITLATWFWTSKSQGNDGAEHYAEKWNEFMGVGNAFLEDASLPSLTREEEKSLQLPMLEKAPG